MNESWVTARTWLRVIRRRYIVQVLMGVLAGVISVYSTIFYFLMPALEGTVVSAWDSIFWTVNRLSTTGELPPELQYSTMPIEALSIVIQISGLAFIFAAFPLAIIPALERRITGAPSPVGAMREHTIVFGFGPVVESLVNELAASTHPFVVVDADLETIRRLQQRGLAAIHADPTEDEAMELANAAEAKNIIANLDDEEDNAKVVLSATSRSSASIYALIDNLSHAHYFRYAGADQVLSPKRLLGTYLAQKAAASWQDELYGAVELVGGIYVVELPIYPGSPLDGLKLRDAKIPERTGAQAIGIWHRGNLEIEPGPDSSISVENVLVAVGTKEQLLTLQQLTFTVEVPELTIKRHYIIAGLGDVGRAVKEVLDKRGVQSKTIDPRETSGDYIRGDATDEATLIEAGIDDASTFIVASHLDRDNIFSTLVARRLNPDLHILARANSRATTDHLYQAGADFVFSLSTIAGQMLAEMLIGDGIVTLAEGLKVLTVPAGPRLIRRTIGSLNIRSRTGATVVGCLVPGEDFCPNPGPDQEILEGSYIVVMGTAAQIKDFKRRF